MNKKPSVNLKKIAGLHWASLAFEARKILLWNSKTILLSVLLFSWSWLLLSLWTTVICTTVVRTTVVWTSVVWTSIVWTTDVWTTVVWTTIVWTVSKLLTGFDKMRTTVLVVWITFSIYRHPKFIQPFMIPIPMYQCIYGIGSPPTTLKTHSPPAHGTYFPCVRKSMRLLTWQIFSPRQAKWLLPVQNRSWW